MLPNPTLTQIALEACEALDALLIALAVTSPAPWPFATETTIMHARTVIGHHVNEQESFK